MTEYSGYNPPTPKSLLIPQFSPSGRGTYTQCQSVTYYTTVWPVRGCLEILMEIPSVKRFYERETEVGRMNIVIVCYYCFYYLALYL